MNNYFFQYETEANASFLVAVFEKDSDLIQYQIRMQQNNKIANLLSVRKYQLDGKTRLCYNVTSKVSLAQMTEREKISKDNMLLLISTLMETCEELPEYQLPVGGLLLDEEHIYLNSGTFEPSFIYLPICSEDSLENVRQFVKKMVMDSRISSTNDGFVQQILDLFNERDLTVEKIRHWVEEKKGGSRQKEKVKLEEPLAPPAFVLPKPIDEKIPVAQAEEEKIVHAPQPKAAKLGKKKDVKKKNENKEDSRGKEKNKSTKERTTFTIVQAVIVLALAVAVKMGVYVAENGTINISYIAGSLIAVAGLDFVLYRELFVNKKSKEKTTTPKKKSKMNEEKRAENKAKALKEDVSEEKLMPAEPPAYEYAPIHMPAKIYSDDPMEGTVLLSDEQEFSEGYLEYYENGLATRIHLLEGTTRVGSLAQIVDHVLMSNRVSKLHAEFIRKGNQYFVRDINSTNGTYLNGSKERIACNQDFELHNGDKVRVANIEMIFKC